MNTSSLEDAKQYLRDHWESGVTCPCCNQYVKLYKRPFNAGMAYSLILLYKEPAGAWIHVQNVFANRHGYNANRMDYSQLQHWDLIEPGRSAGLWRITEHGRNFVLSITNIRQRAHLFNGKIYGYSGDFISIKDALKNKFNYDELMGNTKGESVDSEPPPSLL